MAIPRKQIGWSQESNLLWEISRQMEKLTGVAFNGGGGGGGTPLITKTKSEIDSLISSNGLVPGQFYKVTGVDVPLYGGTDIIMQAATNNQLALQGHGIFYTPKYDQEMLGYNVWSKNILYTALFDEGAFNVGEMVELRDLSDNVLGTATFRNQGLLEWISGSTADWTAPSGTNYIHGVGSNHNAGEFNVTNFPASINPIGGDLTIWGGRVWSSAGGTGNSIDQFTLDANWNLVSYNVNDYNISIDVIHYDYEHDVIISRKDKYDNEVSFNYAILDYGNNPIKAFQWGNGYSFDYGKGVSGCKVLDGSYFECINFRGQWLWDIKLTNESRILGVTFEGNNSEMGYCTLSNLSQMYNIINVNCVIEYINITENSQVYNLNLNVGQFINIEVINGSNINAIRSEGMTFIYNSISNNSSIYDITSWGGSLSSNIVDSSSYISSISSFFSYPISCNSNTLVTYCSMEGNTFAANSGSIQQNVLSSNSHIDGNLLEIGSIIGNNIFQGGISATTFSNSNFNNNTINYSYLNFGTLVSSNIVNLIVNNIGDSLNGFDLTSATYIFNTTPTKTIFNNSANIARLSFYDALDTLQIVNCNA